VTPGVGAKKLKQEKKKPEKKVSKKEGKKGSDDGLVDELTMQMNLAREAEDKRISDLLDIELWSFIAVEALNLATLQSLSVDKIKSHGISINSAKLTLATAPAPDPVSYKLHSKDWQTRPSVSLRSFSIAQSVIGQNLVYLINPEQHTKTSQNQIRLRALHHLNLAAYFAQLCISRAKAEKQPTSEILQTAELVLEASRQAWNTSFSFFNDAAMRDPIRKYFRRFVSIVNHVIELTGGNVNSFEASFRIQMYCLDLQCYVDKEDWKAGYAASHKALKMLPPSLGADIWKFRVGFMNKLGMNVRVGVTQMKDKNPQVRAKIWKSLAISSPNRADQFDFYQEALDAVENPLDKVEYLIDIAEWLFVNKLDIKDCEDYLFSALDILGVLESQLMENETDSRAGCSRSGSSKASNSDRGSTSGADSANSSPRERSMSKSTTHGDAGLSKTANPTALSKERDTASASGVSTIASSTTGISAKIPSSRQLIIVDLVYFFRIYVMLSLMSPTVHERMEYCLLAYYYINRLWDMSVKTANAVIKRARKKEAKLAASTLDPEAAKKKEKDLVEDLKSSVWTLPQSLADWSHYTLPDELCAVFLGSHGKHSQKMLNNETILEPSLLLHYCNVLTQQLCELQYHMFTFPVFTFAQFISGKLLNSRALQILNHLQLARVYDQLNLADFAVRHLNLAYPILPTEAEMHRFTEELEQRQQLNKLAVHSGDHEPDDVRSAGSISDKSSGTADLVVKKVHDSKDYSDALIFIPKDPQIRHIWLHTANILIDFGQIAPAKILLAQVHAHCEAYHDDAFLSLCRRAFGRIAFLEANASLAMDFEYAALKLKGLPEFWLEGVTNLLRAIPWAYRGGLVHEIPNQTLGLLQYTLSEFEELLNSPSLASQKQKPLAVVRALAKIQRILGEFYLDRANSKPLWFYMDIAPGLINSVANLDEASFAPISSITSQIVEINKDLEAGFNLLCRSEALLDSILDRPESAAVLLASARLCMDRDALNYCQPRPPSQMLMFYGNRRPVGPHLITALGKLRKAQLQTIKHTEYVNIPDLSTFMNLPPVRAQAAVQVQLAQLYLVMNSRRRPPRFYHASKKTRLDNTFVSSGAGFHSARSAGSLTSNGEPLGNGFAEEGDSQIKDIDAMGIQGKDGVNTSAASIDEVGSDADYPAAANMVPLAPLVDHHVALSPLKPESGRTEHQEKDFSIDFQGGSVPRSNRASGLVTKRSEMELTGPDPNSSDQHMNTMFFAKYQEIFGAERPVNDYSAAELALAAASTAFVLCSVKLDMPLAECVLGESMAAVALLRKENAEDEAKRQDQNNKLINRAKDDFSRVSTANAENRGNLYGPAPGGHKNPLPRAQTAGKLPKKSGSAKSRGAPAELSEEDRLAMLRSEVIGLDFHHDTGYWSPQLLIENEKLHFPRVAQIVSDEGKAKKAAAPTQKKKEESKKKSKKGSEPGASPVHGTEEEVSNKIKLAEEGDMEVIRFAPSSPSTEFGLRAELKAALQANAVLDLRSTGAFHLKQALDAAFALHQTEVIAKCALGLTNLYGTGEPVEAAMFLSLFISAKVAVYGKKLYRAAADPKFPEALAMYRSNDLRAAHSTWAEHVDSISDDEKTLKPKATAPAPVAPGKKGGPGQPTEVATSLVPDEKQRSLPLCSSLLAVDRFLDRHSVAHRRTTVSHVSSNDGVVADWKHDFETITGGLPEKTFVVTLYFNSHDHCIYLSLVSRHAQYTRVARFPMEQTNENALVELLLRAEQWRRTLQRLILTYGASDPHNSSPGDAALTAAEQEFDVICERMNKLLEPCWQILILSPDFFAEYNVIIISDPALFSLPLETLSIFSKAKSVTREFSLQMLSQRMAVHSKQLRATAAARDTKDIGYIVDAWNEDNSSDGHFRTQLSRIAGASKKDTEFKVWSISEGVNGAERPPNLEDWQSLLNNKNVFVYLGFENYINGIGANVLASTLCSGVEFVCLFDRSTNPASNRRQSKEGNKRSALEISLATPFNTALLLALRGVTTTMLNSFSISGVTNSFLFGEFWAKAIDKTVQLTVGEAYRYIPPPPVLLEDSDGKGTNATRNASAATGRKSSKRNGKSRTSSRNEAEEYKINTMIRSFDRFNAIVVGLPWVQHSYG
jgi:hypothetical protein